MIVTIIDGDGWSASVGGSMMMLRIERRITMEDYGTDASSHVASRVGYDDSSSGGGDHDGEVKKRMMISPRLSTKGDKRSGE